jgi:tight adherence protein C
MMGNFPLITALLLIPVFILIIDDISWEKLSLNCIDRIGDRTNVRNKLTELGYSSQRSYENFRYRQLILIFLLLLEVFLLGTAIIDLLYNIL